MVADGMKVCGEDEAWINNRVVSQERRGHWRRYLAVEYMGGRS
jgi:hypothetical protein